MLTKNTIQTIKSWVKDYENTEEHDCDFTIEMKDSAYELFGDILKELKIK